MFTFVTFSFNNTWELRTLIVEVLKEKFSPILFDI